MLSEILPDRNSDDDVTTSGLYVVICGVKTDIWNKSGRRRNLFYKYVCKSLGGNKTSLIIASECQNDMCKVTADAFFWEIRRLLLRAKPLRKVWTNSLLPLWMDFKGQQTWQFRIAWILQFVTEKVVSHVQDTFFKVHHFDNYDCAKSQIFARSTPCISSNAHLSSSLFFFKVCITVWIRVALFWHSLFWIWHWSETDMVVKVEKIWQLEWCFSFLMDQLLWITDDDIDVRAASTPCVVQDDADDSATFSNTLFPSQIMSNELSNFQDFTTSGHLLLLQSRWFT